MGWDFTIYFQHITIHHHDIAYRDLILGRHELDMLIGILRQLAYQHDAHPSGIALKG